ncbi:MAG: hypothetical protein M0Z99_22170 [Betaproteobacteria bacterium]|nr:hypothetical protein [Betaproteobacteria bacterium]
MIVLNTVKELVRVDAWEDIERRPGFTTELDPKAHVLEAIIGRYAFSNRIRCGLSNCHTPHAKGYIVATKDGHETNIGKDCGKTYFGVDFETLSRKFDQDITEKENRDKLWSFSFKLEEFKTQVHDLRVADRGGNWVYKTSRPLIEQDASVPAEIVRRIAVMTKTRQTVLTLEREATEREIEELEIARGRTLPRPQYIDEPIAEIEGLEALFPENDLRNLLVIELDEKIKAFEGENIDSLTFEQLRRWAKWIGTVDATLQTAAASLESGRRLLQRENLEPFARIIRDRRDEAQFEKYLKSLESTG